MLVPRVSVCSSEVYMKILWIYVVNTLVLTFSLKYLLLKIDAKVLRNQLKVLFAF